ncbi:MAG TPA: rhodanese-like domain-containing protein [Thermoanaerobaculia bacterium]|nr:rhodanese-like domain-containing protein [Thermoanaerobaculia bacterium]
MAKQRHEDTQATSSRNTLIVMTIGALLVAGLVGWALTRTVEAPVATTAPSAMAQFPTTTAASTPGAAPAITETSATAAPATTASLPPQTTAGRVDAPLMATPGPIGDRATVGRMSAEDLREQASAVTVIDVRDATSFAASHIPGSINIPFASIEGQLDLIPKGKPIVTYCT